jgi:hypothetical protein
MANHEVTPRYHSLTPATGGIDRARAGSNTGATAPLQTASNSATRTPCYIGPSGLYSYWN